jgi:hypothetical protein
MRNINLFQSCILLIINKRKGMEYHQKHHNQGVPGSCPGGPTAERQDFQGFMLSKA